MSRKENKIGVKSLLAANKGKGGIYAIHSIHCAGNFCNIDGHHTINSSKFQFGNFGLSFFRVLPPVRSYWRVMEAISKLNELSNSEIDKDGEEARFSVLKSSDRGFKELVKLLKENLLLSGEIHELRIVEGQSGVQIGPSPNVFRTLVSVINGEIKFIIYQPFDPRAPIRELREMNEKALRKAISIILIYLVFIWLILSLLPYSEFIK